MKAGTKRRSSHLRPKHKHTKEYLKHYYPFLPLMVSIGALLMVIFTPLKTPGNVLSYSTAINPDSLLSETNKERSKVSVDQLQNNLLLQNAAQAKAQDMVSRNYWSHQTPDGKEPWYFIGQSGYSYTKAGENLAFGFDDAAGVTSGWLNSQSHKKNMLDPNYREVGFGIASSPNFDNKGPATIVVAMYAQPSTQPGSQANTNVLSGEAGTIRTIQLYTRASWVTYIIGAVIGASVMYLIITHSLTVRRVIAKGEKFIIRNPVLDSIVISLLAAGILMLQTAGSIL